MKVVVLQPSYIPWRGYFDQIRMADKFVFYDCVQYDKHGWRNRNVIKSAAGLQWLTIPVRSKGCVKSGTPIRDIPIVWNSNWAGKHLRSIRMSYSRAPFFDEYSELLSSIYCSKDELLADFTCRVTMQIARLLGIDDTDYLRSSDIPLAGSSNERLLGILEHLGATHYISGPSARSYLNERLFEERGITVEFVDYEYPDYPQLHGEFMGNVSILDLLLNVGDRAADYIWK